MERILLATDGSPSAEHALEVAVALANDTDAALDIVAVRPRRIVGRAVKESAPATSVVY